MGCILSIIEAKNKEIRKQKFKRSPELNQKPFEEVLLNQFTNDL